MDEVIAALAGHAATFELGNAPRAAVEAAKRHLVDSIACAIGGRLCDAAVMGRRLAASPAPPARAAKSLGARGAMAADAAAFVNTAMIRYLDFNDTVHGGHPSDALGAVLAAGDMADCDGKRLLSGLIVAYETAARVIEAAKLRERGWDQGVAIGLGATAAAAHMLRLSHEEAAHALSIIAVANVPTRATRVGELSKWKGAATALACRNALFAALLAGEGMTGPESPFTGRNGVFEQVGPFALRPFGEFLTPGVGMKYWPVENNAQAAVWAAAEFGKVMAPAAVAKIAIFTTSPAWRELGSEPQKWDPKTRETADHSLPYIFARALVDGGLSVRSFDEAAFLDHALRPLMAKITVAHDKEIDRLYPHRVLFRAEAESLAGEKTTIEISDPRGHPLNPMDDGEIAAKFLALAEPALGPARAADALESLWQVEREASTKRLLDRFQFDD
jgi:2-methylcitrate dehydratase